ncbi:hypothetical protein GCM10027347_18930 [Larkinella harenae]
MTTTLLTYYHRNPTGDDAWFAEQSYWLQKTGIIRSNFFKGVLGWDTHLLVSHKLFLLVGAGLIKLFGPQLPVVQLVGFVSFCFLVGGLIYYLKQQHDDSFSWSLLAVLILLFSNRLLIKMSFENRPEIMLAALGFGSFLALNARTQTVSKAALAGFLAGSALLAHLNGVIYLLAGFGTLLYIRQHKTAVIFALTGSFTALLYFADVIQTEHGFETWYYQFRHDPATQNAFGWSSKLMVMLTFPRMFFYSPEEIALSLLVLFLLWNQRALIKNLPTRLKVYSLFLVLSFWIITKKNSGLYCVLFMPFMIALAYELYRLKSFVNRGLKVVLGLYFGIGLFGTVQLIVKNFKTDYLPVSYQKLRSVIPAHQSGLVPLTFFFNEYERYPYLASYDAYKFTAHETEISPDGMAQWAHQNGLKFMVMDYLLSPEDCFPQPGATRLPFYRLLFYDGRFAVYTHQ